MRSRTGLLVVLLVLVLSSAASAAPVPIAGQVSGTVPKDARALLVPLLSSAESARLEMEGKADPEPVASAAVAADGTFRLEAPEPGMYKVVVRAPGFVSRQHLLTPLVEETELEAVELEKDLRLEVRVTGPDGKPAAGVPVLAEAALSRAQTLLARWRAPDRAGLTDEQGKLVMPRGASESLFVRAGAPGLPVAERRDVRASALSFGLRSGVIRELRVLNAAGRPVAGAVVRLGTGRWTLGRTSQDGLLAVPLPGSGKLLVRVRAEDGRSAEVYLEPKRPEETGPRDLRLPLVETLAGRVVSSADGRPVAGALVWASRDRSAFQRTGADGGYKVSVETGSASIQVAAAGFFPGGAEWLVKSGDRRGPTLTLEPSLTAAGVVVDEQGRPVAGVEVRAGPPGSTRSRSGGQARTSGAGRFRISGLAAGVVHELRLAKRGYAPLKAELPPLEPGRPAAEPRLVLRRGRTAFGRVVTPADQPVPGARVVLEPANPPDSWRRMARLPEPGIEAAADEGGRFEIPDLPPGVFDLTARGPGFAPVTVTGLSVPEGGGSVDLGTVVLPAGVPVEGYVTDPQGRPVEGAEVHVSKATGDMFPLMRTDFDPAAMSGQDGFFRVADRRAGETVNVDARRSGFAPGGAPGVRVPPDEPVRIVLKPSAAVEGRAVDPDGKPVAGARVVITPEEPEGTSPGFAIIAGQIVRQAVTGDDGNFRVEDVQPGPFELRATAAGRQAAEMKNLEVASGRDLKGIEVVLAPAAFLEGRVLAGERPVAGAAVQVVEPEEGSFRFSSRPETTSDGDGYYRLDGVIPGARTVQAAREGYRKAVRELEVRPGENGLDFNLEGGTEVSGRVVDDGGVPVAGARVLLYEGIRSWDLPSATSGSDGSFTLSGVADGTYRVKAEKDGYAEDGQGQEVTVASGGPVGGVEVRLSAGGAIVGQISGFDPTELSQVRVWADHPMHGGRVSPDGTYRIDNVAPGERRVVASVRGSRQAEGRVTVEPGASETRLDLELGEGHLLTGRVLRNDQPARGELVWLNGASGAGRRTETDHEGRFRFEGLEPGSYELEVLNRHVESQHKETLDLSGDRDVLIRLATVVLTGRVVDSADRGPIPGALVRLLPADGSESFFHPESTTDSRGQFRLPDVPEGTWTLRAQLSGYAPEERAVQVDAGAPPDALEIPLQATEGVTLEVLLPSGRSPDSVRVAVLDPAGRVVASSTHPTGENGRLRIASVAPGTWEILLDADASAPVTLPVTAPGNGGRVVLPLPGALDLSVPSLAGARIKATARLTDASGKPYRYGWEPSRADHDLDAGSLEIDRIAPGTWKVDVTAADGRTWSGTATVVPGGRARVTLE